MCPRQGRFTSPGGALTPPPCLPPHPPPPWKAGAWLRGSAFCSLGCGCSARWDLIPPQDPLVGPACSPPPSSENLDLWPGLAPALHYAPHRSPPPTRHSRVSQGDSPLTYLFALPRILLPKTSPDCWAPHPSPGALLLLSLLATGCRGVGQGQTAPQLKPRLRCALSVWPWATLSLSEPRVFICKVGVREAPPLGPQRSGWNEMKSRV